MRLARRRRRSMDGDQHAGARWVAMWRGRMSAEDAWWTGGGGHSWLRGGALPVVESGKRHFCWRCAPLMLWSSSALFLLAPLGTCRPAKPPLPFLSRSPATAEKNRVCPRPLPSLNRSGSVMILHIRTWSTTGSSSTTPGVREITAAPGCMIRPGASSRLPCPRHPFRLLVPQPEHRAGSGVGSSPAALRRTQLRSTHSLQPRTSGSWPMTRPTSRTPRRITTGETRRMEGTLFLCL